MGDPIQLNGSVALQFKDGTHQPQVKINGIIDRIFPVEGNLPNGENHFHEKTINISVNGIANHNYQLQVSQDLQAWQNYGQLLTVDDVDGVVTNISGIDVEEIVVSKPIYRDKEFYRVMSTRAPGDIHSNLDDFGVLGYMDYVLQNPNQNVMEYGQFLMNNLSSKVDINFRFDELILAFPNKEDALTELQSWCLVQRAERLRVNLGRPFEGFTVEMKQSLHQILDILDSINYSGAELSFTIIFVKAKSENVLLDKAIAIAYDAAKYGTIDYFLNDCSEIGFTFDKYLEIVSFDEFFESLNITGYREYILTNFGTNFDSIKAFAENLLTLKSPLKEPILFKDLYVKGINVISAMNENINILKVNKSYPNFIELKQTYSNAEDVVINSIAKMIDDGVELVTNGVTFNELADFYTKNNISSLEILSEVVKFLSGSISTVIGMDGFNYKLADNKKISITLSGVFSPYDCFDVELVDNNGKRVRNLNTFVNLDSQNTLSFNWDGRDLNGNILVPSNYNIIVRAKKTVIDSVSSKSVILDKIMSTSLISISALASVDGCYNRNVREVGINSNGNVQLRYDGWLLPTAGNPASASNFDNLFVENNYSASASAGSPNAWINFTLTNKSFLNINYQENNYNEFGWFGGYEGMFYDFYENGVNTIHRGDNFSETILRDPGVYAIKISQSINFGSDNNNVSVEVKRPYDRTIELLTSGQTGAKSHVKELLSVKGYLSKMVDDQNYSYYIQKIDDKGICFIRENKLSGIREYSSVEGLSLDYKLFMNGNNIYAFDLKDANGVQNTDFKVMNLEDLYYSWNIYDSNLSTWKESLAETVAGLSSGERIIYNKYAFRVLESLDLNVVNSSTGDIKVSTKNNLSSSELLGLCRYAQVLEYEKMSLSEIKMVLNKIYSNNNSLIEDEINSLVSNKCTNAIAWFKTNGYTLNNEQKLKDNPYITLKMYYALKDIKVSAADIKINVNDLFTTTTEDIGFYDYRVVVLTDFLRLNNIYKGNNLFKDIFAGNIEEQRKYVQPRYEDILNALELRQSLQGIPNPLQYISETAAEINILLNNVDYQKMVAFHRFVMDLNTYATSLKLPDYIASHAKLSFSDYFTALNNGVNPGLVNYLATKNYFNNQVTPGEANIYIDTVGSYKLLYSGQAIFVQEAGDIYYRMAKIVMPSHFSVIEKATNPNGVAISTTTSTETHRVVPAEFQRELWFYLIQQGYLTSTGLITETFTNMQTLANASTNKDQYILDHFHLSPNLTGYEVSAFKKIEEMGLGNWIQVKDKMIPVGEGGWVNTAEHTIEIARKTGTNYTTLKTMTNTYFDATSFVGLFKDISTLAEIDTLPYSNNDIADWCFELNELMSDTDMFNQAIPDLKRFLFYRNEGKNVLQAYLAAYFEKLDAIHDTADGFPTINYANQDVQNIFNQLNSPIASDFFTTIEVLTATQSTAIINLLKTSGVLTPTGAVSFNFNITNSAQDLGLGTEYQQYAHQIFTLLAIEKKAVEKKFFRIIFNLVDIQSRLSPAERATNYDLKDYVYLSEDFKNYSSDDIVKLRNMFAMSNILGKKLTTNSIQSLINVYDNSGNALDAVLATGGLMTADVQKVIDEYEPIINAVTNITENIICTYDASGQNGVLRIGELKNIASLKVYHKDELVYVNNDYDGLDFVKDIPIPNGSSIDPIRLEIVYIDGTSEPKIVYPLDIDVNSNVEDVKFLKVLDEMSSELDNSLELYGLKYGEELIDYKPYIAELGKMYISAKVLADKSGTNPALSAKDIVNAYSTALIVQEFPTTQMPDSVWKKVWLINNRDKLSLFDDSIKSLMMKASIDLKEDSTEINKKGERYQLMIGGVGYTHGADCGNTAGFGDAKVIGVLDTFTGQLIQVPAETIARAKDVKWIGDTGQLERQQRDLAVESAQRSLSLKSSYACQMGEYTKPENAMRFDTVTTTSWKDLVADSETAVASYSTVLEERKHFIVDLMRNVTRNSSLSESDARVMYDKFLTLFKDYLPNVKNIDSNSSPINKNSLSITYPGNNMNYIHKDNEPQGLYISKEAILILQRMKNAGVNISSIVNSTLSQSVVETYIDAETIGQVKATQLLSKNISAHTDGSPAVNVTPTVTNLYGGILKNILSKLFDTDMTVAKAIETLPIIQAKYPNLISDAELGSIGVATFAMLSYLQVINDKSLMLKFKTLNDLPERISLEQEDYTKNVLDDEGKVTSTEAKKGTAFQFMKVTKNGMIEVVFSPTGQVKSSVYSDGTVRTKTLKSMADNAVESFTDDEFQVSSNSTVQIGAISNFSPQYPRSGAYNVYAGWNVVGEIAKNIVLAMIIGEVTGLLANMAGMKDLYTLYSTTQRSVDIAKAGVNGEMQQLVNNVVGNVVPAGIVNMANGAYGAYKTFETQYNTIKADMDKLVKDSLAGNNTIQQLNQIQSSVNATLQTTQTQLNQLKQDVLNKVGAYEHMTEAELKKASESLMALERQVAYTRYEMEQKLKAMGNKVPGVDIPVQVCLLAEEEIPNICETVKNASGEDIQITMTGSEGLFEINTPNSMLKIRNGFPVAYSNKKSGNVGVFTFNQVISGEKSIEEYLQNVGEMISSEIGETSYFLYDLPGMKIDIKDVIGESVSVSVNSGLSKKTELLYDFNKGTIVTKSYGFSEKEKSGLLGTLKKQLITIIMNKSVKMAKSTKEEWEKINKVIDSSQPRLTSEELTKQLAVMSDWVYFWENDPNKGNREKYAKNLALLKANGWTQYYEEGYDQSMENAVNYDNKTGYHGRILINNNSKQIVFVHRGTEFDRGGLTSVLDIVSDVAILFGMNLQVSSAKKLYEIFFKSNPTYKGYEIIHTGHSLGGAIAQEMAIMYNRNNGDKAVCFAGLGIHDRIKKWEKMNKGKSIDFINNYVVAEDALLWIYPQAGSLFIENKNGSEFGEKSLQQNKINVRSFIINRQDYTSSHSMDYYMDGYHPAENLATYEKLKYYWLAYRTISNYSSIFSRWDMDNITPIGLIRKIGE